MVETTLRGALFDLRLMELGGERWQFGTSEHY